MPVEHDIAGRFAAAVRAAREARGWSQADLADRMTRLGYGMHQTTVAKIEREAVTPGKGRPLSLGEAAGLAHLLSIPLSAGPPEAAALLRLEAALSALADLERRAALLAVEVERARREVAQAEADVRQARQQAFPAVDQSAETGEEGGK